MTHCDHAHLHCLEEEGTQQRGPGKGQFSQCRLGVGQGAELQLPLDNSLLPLTTDIHTDTHRILKAISKYNTQWSEHMTGDFPGPPPPPIYNLNAQFRLT